MKRKNAPPPIGQPVGAWAERLRHKSYVIGDVTQELARLPDKFAQCCVTSPPYWGLRDYGVAGQLGLETTPDAYIAKMVAVFRDVRRVLRDDGTLWLNVGDTYARGGGPNPGNATAISRPGGNGRYVSPATIGLKRKDLVGIPWMLAFALRDDGWYLRTDIIWHKTNPLPESVTDRPNRSHEYVFLLSKSERYYYDADAVREPHRDLAGGPSRFGDRGQKSKGVKGDKTGHARSRMSSHTSPSDGYHPAGRNRRTVWDGPCSSYKGAHFATYPPRLIEPCVLAGSPRGGIVLDPFLGSGTTGMVSERLGRRWFGIELNPEYERDIRDRTAQVGLFSHTEGPATGRGE